MVSLLISSQSEELSSPHTYFKRKHTLQSGEHPCIWRWEKREELQAQDDRVGKVMIHSPRLLGANLVGNTMDGHTLVK